MKQLLIIAAALTLAASFVFAQEEEEWWESEVGPEQDSIEYVRKYFNEGSYSWAEDKALDHLKKYPDTEHAAELDYILAYSGL
ncbi:MAG: hypothetical protein GY771_01785, partial [bacterium]|nr:hypothetical protein [bacterium]